VNSSFSACPASTVLTPRSSGTEYKYTPKAVSTTSTASFAGCATNNLLDAWCSAAPPKPPAFAPGGEGWNESTPPVLTPYQALAGLELTLAIGVERLRAYSLGQQHQLKKLLAQQGIEAEGANTERGAFLTVRHPRARDLANALDAHGVHTDARGEYLRLCPDILNPEAELAEAAARLGEAARKM